jgi:hypothetical protein
MVAGSEGIAEETELVAGVAPAVKALNELLSTERCPPLVEAIVTKYVALSPEELQEWQVRLCCRPSHA